MIQNILTDGIVSISELKTNPHKVISDSKGQPVAVLSRNKPIFYALPTEYYAELLERLDNLELLQTVKDRQHEPAVKVHLNDL